MAAPVSDAWKQQGFDIEFLQTKSASKPKAGQMVTVHCTGYGKNGDMTKTFWTTRKSDGAAKDEPFTFQIGKGKVIKGWDEGVAQMGLGDRAKVKCSPSFAYGAGGFPAWGILPNSPLIFDIELLQIK
eukprot:CAMPEP_0202716500 /NCGR_PEP_ID=MMETSP1385-20130828/101983_1 /ASSEMBLY_ACC=CAM_ASM_000861 /TAXON_ID=933848 /ORGANISM="Elphidium margaritaceum" /LENGTH=127 /DNA_ID=CAMNT_0049378275 /DNA_START=19 /DNA_END=402 /DNA_ORIENTATION=-